MENSHFPCHRYSSLLWVLHPISSCHYICYISFHLHGTLDMLPCIIRFILLLSCDCCQFSPSSHHKIYLHCSVFQGETLRREENSEDIFHIKHYDTIDISHPCVANNEFSNTVGFEKLLWRSSSHCVDTKPFSIRKYEFHYLYKPEFTRSWPGSLLHSTVFLCFSKIYQLDHGQQYSRGIFLLQDIQCNAEVGKKYDIFHI